MKKALAIVALLSVSSVGSAEDIVVRADNPNDISIESSTGQKTIIKGNSLVTSDGQGNTVKVDNIDNTLLKANEMMAKGMAAAGAAGAAAAGAGVAAGNAAMAAKSGGMAVPSKMGRQKEVDAAEGKAMPGRYDVSIATQTGAETYAGISDVTIFKDGGVYTEADGSYVYSGSIRFKTESGELKTVAGMISLARE